MSEQRKLFSMDHSYRLYEFKVIGIVQCLFQHETKLDEEDSCSATGCSGESVQVCSESGPGVRGVAINIPGYLLSESGVVWDVRNSLRPISRKQIIVREIELTCCLCPSHLSIASPQHPPYVNVGSSELAGYQSCVHHWPVKILQKYGPHTEWVIDELWY